MGEIFHDQRAQKMHGAGAVGEDVIDLKIDGRAEVADGIEQIFVPRAVKAGAEPTLFGGDGRGKGGFLKVIPEEAAAQDIAEGGKAACGFCEGFGESFRYNRLGQLTGEAENMGFGPRTGGREELGRIVQPIPFGSDLIHLCPGSFLSAGASRNAPR